MDLNNIYHGDVRTYAQLKAYHASLQESCSTADTSAGERETYQLLRQMLDDARMYELKPLIEKCMRSYMNWQYHDGEYDQFRKDRDYLIGQMLIAVQVVERTKDAGRIFFNVEAVRARHMLKTMKRMMEFMEASEEIWNEDGPYLVFMSCVESLEKFNVVKTCTDVMNRLRTLRASSEQQLSKETVLSHIHFVMEGLEDYCNRYYCEFPA